MKIAIFGATGRAGRELMLQALVKGYDVQALVRKPQMIDVRDKRLHVIAGDVRDLAAVEETVSGADVVCVALGARSGEKHDVHSTGTQHIIDAMKRCGIRRILVISSTGLFGSRDSGFVFGNIIRPLFLRKVFNDKRKQLTLLEKSGLEWILIRPVRLIDGQKTGKYHISDDKPEGKEISCADVADFMMGQLISTKYLQKMPILSY